MKDSIRSLDSLYRTLTTTDAPVLIDHDQTTYYEITDVDTDADELTVNPLPVVGTTSDSSKTIPAEDVVHLSVYSVISQSALEAPERVLEKYAGQHLSDDLRVLGRQHEHNGAEVDTIAGVEFALWAATSDDWPPTSTEDDE